MQHLRAAVVGGGLIGLATARELLARVPGAEVVVYEKERTVGVHQSGHNSGVVHAGLYYEPGSLKAQLCRRGATLLAQFARDHGVRFEECGKLVVAQDATDVERLRTIHQRAVENGVPDVRLVDSRQMREIEPHVTGLAALYSPHTAIVDYVGICHALADDVVAAGGTVSLGDAVSAIDPIHDDADPVVTVTAATGRRSFDLVIACAGLQSDRLAVNAGDGPSPRIIPFFGDYYELSPEKSDLIRGLVYPVPDPRYPFLGVHVTKRIDGSVVLGPNAFLSLGREAYRRGRWSARDTADVLRFGGFWLFALRNARAAARELRTVVSSRLFLREARRYVPVIGHTDISRGPRGIRAQAMNRDGSLEDDFVITGRGRIMHVRNAPSPGATSCLAIAEHVVGEALARIGRK